MLVQCDVVYKEKEGMKERSPSYSFIVKSSFFKVHIVSNKSKSTQKITLILFVHSGLQFEFYPKFNVFQSIFL